MAEFQGLTTREAERKLKEVGYNEIKDIHKVSWLEILLRQIKNNFIIYLLTITVIISFLVGKGTTAYTIIAVIILVIIAGFVQEYKADRAVAALKEMIVPISIVIRNGREIEVLTREIVPGDLLILRNGEKIPADSIILEESELIVDESILTGESKEIKKLAISKKSIINEINTLYAGSFITNGRCIAQVSSTGMKTKFGKIAGLISKAEKELLLQKKVNKITRYMAFIGIFVSVLTGLVILSKTPIINSEAIIGILILTIAISVSSFPEGFPVVLITTLSIGAYRMAKKNAIVNRMSVIETLGETTVICSDKTGTITKGEMTIKEIHTITRKYNVEGVGYEAQGDFLINNSKVDVLKEKNLKLLLKTGILCNDSKIARTGEDKIYHIIGAPTEAALLIAGAKANMFQEEINNIREKEIPFSSERKMMSVLCKEQKDEFVYSKGAIEHILEKCTRIQKENGVFKILKKDKETIKQINKEMTSRALRVIALAYKKFDDKNESIEENLVFMGLVGMEDAPREEVKEALATCRQAGIKVKMITGDDRETAVAIAAQIGLSRGEIVEGKDLDSMTDSELIKRVMNIVIFARVKPEHKIRIVRALKENKEIVTMTGDGVNDAPALKEAHVGVAMGKNGTDVSRAAADLTIKDDNFATIVEAIKEGRTIFHNLRKFISYQLSCNYAELSILFFGVLFSSILGWPIPILLALQILFMNLVTDNIPAVTLGINPSSGDIMDDKPKKNAQLLTKNIFLLIVFTGSLMALVTLLVFYSTFNILHDSAEYARTAALVALIGVEVGGAFVFRSFRKGVFNRSPFVNKYLFIASMISIIATIAIIYTPLSKVFETTRINGIEWLIAVGLTLLFVAIFDILKYINKKKNFWKEE